MKYKDIICYDFSYKLYFIFCVIVYRGICLVINLLLWVYERGVICVVLVNIYVYIIKYMVVILIFLEKNIFLNICICMFIKMWY